MSKQAVARSLRKFATAAVLVALACAAAPGGTGMAAPAPQPGQGEPAQTRAASYFVDAVLSISKTASVEYVAAGGLITYSIRVQHAIFSGSAARDVVVTDVLPREVDYVSGPVCGLGPQSADRKCAYDPSTRTITASWSSLGLAGGAAQVDFTVRANDNLRCGRDLENLAAVQWSNSPGGVPRTAWTKSSVRPSLRADSLVCPTVLPGTAFRPWGLRPLGTAPAPRSFTAFGMSLEIPRLGISQMNIVNVPLAGGTWDISGLADNAGWLEGTATPGQRGNSVLTAHVTDIYGLPGPFAQLDTLAVGDQVVLHASGQVFTYVVQNIRDVAPSDLSVVEDMGGAVLTLLTCSRPNYTTQTYDGRLAVQAVLVQQIQAP